MSAPKRLFLYFFLVLSVYVEANTTNPGIDQPISPSGQFKFTRFREEAHRLLLEDEPRRTFDRAIAELVSNNSSSVRENLKKSEVDLLQAYFFNGLSIRQVIIMGNMVALARLRTGDLEVSQLPESQQKHARETIDMERRFILETLALYVKS